MSPFHSESYESQATDDALNASSVISFLVRDLKRLTKTTDYETSFQCGGGTGTLREEGWMNALPFFMGRDNGRVLGYDNAAFMSVIISEG